MYIYLRVSSLVLQSESTVIHCETLSCFSQPGIITLPGFFLLFHCISWVRHRLHDHLSVSRWLHVPTGMEGRLSESEAKCPTCPGSQICLRNKSQFLSKLQNKICNLIVWSFCYGNRLVERRDIFSYRCMVIYWCCTSACVFPDYKIEAFIDPCIVWFLVIAKQ
jgi:hypothetical protein